MPDTPENSTGTGPTDPQAPAGPAAPANGPAAQTPAHPGGASTVEVTPEIKALIDAAFAKGRDKGRDQATETTTKTLEERITAAEAQVAKAESRALTALIAAAAKDAYSPEQVAKLIDLGDLTSEDADAVQAKVAEFLTKNPHHVKPAADVAQAPAPQGTPGAGAGGDTKSAPGAGVMKPEEFAATTPEDLQDPETLKRYVATLEQQ